MTDGESSDINPPLDAAISDHLRAENITVFTIMLTGDKISQPLIGITRATGGEVFNAVTPEALTRVFKSIDEMKKVIVLEKRPQVIDFRFRDCGRPLRDPSCDPKIFGTEPADICAAVGTSHYWEARRPSHRL